MAQTAVHSGSQAQGGRGCQGLGRARIGALGPALGVIACQHCFLGCVIAPLMAAPSVPSRFCSPVPPIGSPAAFYLPFARRRSCRSGASSAPTAQRALDAFMSLHSSRAAAGNLQRQWGQTVANTPAVHSCTGVPAMALPEGNI